MNPGDQDLLAVGTVEDAEAPQLRRLAVRAPEKVVVGTGNRIGVGTGVSEDTSQPTQTSRWRRFQFQGEATGP